MAIPAAVVFDADHLSTAAMQTIATRTGLSETAFLSRSDTATFKLDFFTPRRRIAHCGHATVAAFGYLEAKGRLAPGTYSKDTVDGLRTIVVDKGYAGMQQRAPSFIEPDAADMLDALGVSSRALDPRFPPIVVNTGNSFALVGLKSEDDLAGLVPDMAAVERISDQYDLVGFYPFVAGCDRNFHAVARMFGPRYGIAEEAATGMAAGPLASLLHRGGIASKTVSIGQGRFMKQPSPSAIEVRLTVERNAVVDIIAGGSAALIRDTVVEYELG